MTCPSTNLSMITNLCLSWCCVDMKTKEADTANEEEKEAPLDILYERSQTKNSTKKSKSAKVKEDPEEDATVSDEDEEEEDSQEEDDDDDEDDDEDDEDADASVSMQQSGSMKKARVRRNKQKQTSRKLWSNQVSIAFGASQVSSAILRRSRASS